MIHICYCSRLIESTKLFGRSVFLGHLLPWIPYLIILRAWTIYKLLPRDSHIFIYLFNKVFRRLDTWSCWPPSWFSQILRTGQIFWTVPRAYFYCSCLIILEPSLTGCEESLGDEINYFYEAENSEKLYSCDLYRERSGKILDIAGVSLSVGINFWFWVAHGTFCYVFAFLLWWQIGKCSRYFFLPCLLGVFLRRLGALCARARVDLLEAKDLLA